MAGQSRSFVIKPPPKIDWTQLSTTIWPEALPAPSKRQWMILELSYFDGPFLLHGVVRTVLLNTPDVRIPVTATARQKQLLFHTRSAQVRALIQTVAKIPIVVN